MEELIETIVRQWDEDTVFKFIKDLDDEMADWDFTTRLYHHFDEQQKIQDVIATEELNLEQHETNLTVTQI
jgi:hypothetical protein